MSHEFKKESKSPVYRSDARFLREDLVDSLHAILSNSSSIEPYADPDIPNSKKREMRAVVADALRKNGPNTHLPKETLEKFEVYDIEIPGCVEEPDAPLVKGTVLIPPVEFKSKRKKPVLLFIPGGALYMAEYNMFPIYDYALGMECCLVAFTYRTAIDAPYPAAINDAHAAYQWVYDHAKEYGWDKNNIGLMGVSAGVTLSTALPHRLKRYGHSPKGTICFEAGAIEDRPVYNSMKLADTMWNAEVSQQIVKLYLDKEMGSPFLSPEAMANRATLEECKGLCPHWFFTCEFDPYVDVYMDYSARLREVGVFTELHEFGAVPHGGTNMSLTMGLDFGYRSQRIINECVKDMFQYDFRRKFLTEEETEEE